MALGDAHDITTFIDPEFGGKYLMTTSFGLSGASKYGWLLIVGDDCILFFYTPFTRVTIQLPKSLLPSPLPNCSNYVFSAAPTCSSCVVAAFETRFDKRVHYTSPGKLEWYAFDIHHHIPHSLSSLSVPTFYGKNLYVLCEDGELGIVKFDQNQNPSWDVVVVEPQRSLLTSASQHFLVECGGHILSINMDGFGECVEVLKLNHSKLPWELEKVYDIGQHMIFVCDTSCISLVSKVKGMENKIYFPRFDGGGNIIFYSLKSRKFHTYGCNNKDEDNKVLKDMSLTEEQLNCAWIEPRWSS